MYIMQSPDGDACLRILPKEKTAADWCNQKLINKERHRDHYGKQNNRRTCILSVLCM